VRARAKKGILYLITNEPALTEEQAWEIFFSYRRRWQIETSFRYAKCELALECPRLWELSARLKLLGMVMFVYAFLLSLLDPVHSSSRAWLGSAAVVRLPIQAHKNLFLCYAKSNYNLV
jgi:hypothetical protein